jgi:hypothetical protein
MGLWVPVVTGSVPNKTMEGVLTVEPSPKIAAQLAKNIYGVQNEFLLGFF